MLTWHFLQNDLYRFRFGLLWAYIHLHTLQVEDEKFVQICGKSLFWHADSSKSSDYLPLSYQSHFQFHLDHILSSYTILTTQLQYLIYSFFTSVDHHIPFQIHYLLVPFQRSTPTTHSNHLCPNWLPSIPVASFTRTTPTTNISYQDSS